MLSLSLFFPEHPFGSIKLFFFSFNDLSTNVLVSIFVDMIDSAYHIARDTAVLQRAILLYDLYNQIYSR